MATLTWGLASSSRRRSSFADPRAATLGTDVSALPSLGKRFRLVSGNENLAEALARRLMTPRGSLHYAPNYGTDVRQWLNEAFTQRQMFRLRAAIESELLKDPRVESASADVTYDAASESLSISVSVIAGDGPFDFVLKVTSLTAELLS